MFKLSDKDLSKNARHIFDMMMQIIMYIMRNLPFFSSDFSLPLPDFEQAYGESTEGSGNHISGLNKKNACAKEN